MTYKLETVFPVVIQYANAIYWTICIVLFFLRVPKTQEFLPYRKAKAYMSMAFLTLGCNLVGWLLITQGYPDGWGKRSPYVAANDFIFFYLEVIFFSYSFHYLINPQYLTARRKAKDFAIYTMAATLMLLSTHLRHDMTGLCLSAIAFLAFACHVILFLFHFHRLYEERRRVLDDYFPEDMQRFMFWIKKSLFFLVLMLMLGSLSLVFGIAYNYLFQVYIISVNIYIACSFINYAALFSKLSQANTSIAEEEKADKEEEKADKEEEKANGIENYEQLFGQKMDAWLSEKKYLVAQLTIDDLASEMGTNKLYMSRYINRKYEMSFRTWITRLRLAEAKEFMIENPNIKQEEIALHSGFSSSSYFSKVFSKAEGISPAAWLRETFQSTSSEEQ